MYPFFAYENMNTVFRKNPNVIYGYLLTPMVFGAAVSRNADLFGALVVIFLWLEARLYRASASKHYKRVTTIILLSCVITLIVCEIAMVTGAFVSVSRTPSWFIHWIPRASAEFATWSEGDQSAILQLRQSLFVITTLMTVLTLVALGLNWRSYRRQCIEVVASRRRESSLFGIYSTHGVAGLSLVAMALFMGNARWGSDPILPPELAPLMLQVGISLGTSLIASMFVLRSVFRPLRFGSSE